MKSNLKGEQGDLDMIDIEEELEDLDVIDFMKNQNYQDVMKIHRAY
jgi:hypothetical protein